MLKKIAFMFVLALVVPTVVVANGGGSPTEVVETFFRTMERRDVEAARGFLCSGVEMGSTSDIEDENLQEFKIDVTVEEITNDGDQATVSAVGQITWDYGDEEIDVEDFDLTIGLKKQDDGWCIDTGLEAGQAPAQTASQPDTLTVRGGLIQGTVDGVPIPAGLLVRLFMLDTERMPVQSWDTVSDENSLAVFEGIPRAPGYQYVVWVEYDGIRQGEISAPIAGSEEEISLDITLYEHSIDRSLVTIKQAQILVNYARVNEAGLEIRLDLQLINNGDRIVTTGQTTTDGKRISMEIVLPSDAFSIGLDSDTRYLLGSLNGAPVVKDTNPLYPNQLHHIALRYFLPYTDSARLTHLLDYQLIDATVLLPNDTVMFDSSQFDIEGKFRYRLNGLRLTELEPDEAFDGDDPILIKAHDLLQPLDADEWLIFSLSGIPARTALSPVVPLETSPLPGDSGQIAFVSNRTGPQDIYIMDADGSNIRQLTASSADDQLPAWSPDGSQIAFTSFRDGPSEIYVMNVDGTNLRNLTGDAIDGGFPTWSPDGNQIAFSSHIDGNEEIYVVDANGDNLRRLTNHDAWDGEPAWSPDGNWIAFTTERDENWEIYLMDPDGGNLRRLTDDLADDGYPTWSPDSKRIAFMSNRDGVANIHVMDANGTHIRNLTHSYMYDSFPAWSPDGSWILFAVYYDGNQEIYIMDIDGNNIYRLTNHDAPDWRPAWRPTP